MTEKDDNAELMFGDEFHEIMRIMFYASLPFIILFFFAHNKWLLFYPYIFVNSYAFMSFIRYITKEKKE